MLSVQMERPDIIWRACSFREAFPRVCMTWLNLFIMQEYMNVPKELATSSRSSETEWKAREINNIREENRENNFHCLK